jgi:hypothetical protein
MEAQYDPQVIKEGNWKIQGTQVPCVSLSKKELNIPLGQSEHDQACRAHEFGHIRFSKTRHSKFARLMEYQAVEDARVNMCLKDRAISVKNISDKVIHPKGYKNSILSLKDTHYEAPTSERNLWQGNHKHVAASTWMACEGIGKEEAIRVEMESLLDKKEVELLHNLRGYLESHKNEPDATLKVAVLLDKYFLEKREPEGEEPSDSKGKEKDGEPGEHPSDIYSGKPKISEADKEYLDKIRKLPPEEYLRERMNWFHDPEKAKQNLAMMYGKDANGKYALNEDNKEWGNYIVLKPPLTRKQPSAIAKISKKRATDEGSIFRYPHRYIADKCVFSEKARRKGKGTILLDMSGSMCWNQERLLKILDAMPNATVIGYGSRNKNEGTIVLLAKHGRTVAGIPYVGSSNGIDGRALEYMITNHRSPYYFVTDKLYTAYEPGYIDETDCGCNLKDELETLAERKGVRFVPNYDCLCGAIRRRG